MDVFAISRQARAGAPVFIVGEARSGTSMLYRTLQKHTSFKPREENLQESNIVALAPRAYRFAPRHPKSLWRYMLKNDRRYGEFLESLRPLRPLLLAADTARERLGDLDLAWRLGPSRLVVRSFLHHAQLARGVRRVLEKKPTLVNDVGKLVATYPRAKLLYIHRHPVDVYTSYVRRTQVDPNAKWARVDVERFSALYRANSLQALREHQRRPQTLLVVRYQDFTTDTATQFRRVCAFLDEPFEPDAIVERNPDLTRWERAPHLYGEITPQTKRWQDYLSADEAAALQGSLRPVMARLGYTPYVPA